MFTITRTSNGERIGMTETPTYIKQAENGCYNLCPGAGGFGHCF